jgi:hypothetical protein
MDKHGIKAEHDTVSQLNLLITAPCSLVETTAFILRVPVLNHVKHWLN